jgi:hypothetical protein
MLRKQFIYKKRKNIILLPKSNGIMTNNYQIDNINQTFPHDIIYVYSIPDRNYKSKLKIDSVTISSSNSRKINKK